MAFYVLVSSTSPRCKTGSVSPHLLLGLGLPMHLVVSLRSGQRMHGEGDAGNAPNFLGIDQPRDFEEASESDDLSLSATALSFSGASKSEQVRPTKAKAFKWADKNITITLHYRLIFCRGKLFDMYDFRDEDLGNIQVDSFPPRNIFQHFGTIPIML